VAQWFRFYNEALDDPKVQKLPAETFRGWVNLLCLAARNDGNLPLHNDIAFALRLPDAKATALLDALIEAELLDHDETGIRPHNWNTRQYKSDVSNERVKRHRERSAPVTCNVTSPVTVTPPETEQSQKQNRTEKPNPTGLGKKPTKGTRIAADWTVGEQDREHAHQRGWGDQRIAAQALKFRDHWLASDDDRKARKRDWNAAWRTWCDNADKWDPEQPAGKRGRATEGERANALFASVAPELGDRGNVAGERGRSEERSRRGGDGTITVGYEVIPDADEPPICQPSTAAQGIVGDMAGVACEVSPGRSETGLGSRSKNPQMGDPAEDRANGGSGGIGPVVSAQAESQSNVGQGDFAAGMGQAGSDADYFAIPKFLQQ